MAPDADTREDRGMRGRCLPFVTLAGVVTMAGCATPCVDDGLNQEFCPENETDAAGESDGGTDSETGAETDSDTGPGSGSGGNVCPDLNVLLEPRTPTLQLVVDQSGSMSEDFGGVTRWEAIENTLIDAADGVVTRLQSNIRFGLSLYTNEGMTCPDVEEMAPQLDARDEIETLFAMNMPAGDTPTGESLEVVTASLQTDTWDGEKFIVLATDGEPDTCDMPDPMTDEEIDTARGRAVDAVAAAYAEGIRTFVISVGEAIGEAHLQDLANAGVGNAPGDPDAPFYQALDQQSLVDAFDTIISGVRECKLELSDPLTPELATSCDVTINETSIPYDDPDGWRLDDAMTIELIGASCTSIQEGLVSIEMTCSC